MATSVMTLNPWVDRTYNFQGPQYFYGPKNVWAHKNFLDTYNLRGAHFDHDERKDIGTEFDCVSKDLCGLSRIDKRHYKKDSRFVLDLYTLTYGSTETLDSIGDMNEVRRMDW
uniref:Uncharacterized protein n=1 Tax=Cacopsylla melanoneura TaxID=428564 RepID=A0A8D9E6M8_9HEMI